MSEQQPLCGVPLPDDRDGWKARALSFMRELSAAQATIAQRDAQVAALTEHMRLVREQEAESRRGRDDRIIALTDELIAATDRGNSWQSVAADLTERLRQEGEQLAAAREREQWLESVLAFYADEKQYAGEWHHPGDSSRKSVCTITGGDHVPGMDGCETLDAWVAGPINSECGKRARAIIAALQADRDSWEQTAVDARIVGAQLMVENRTSRSVYEQQLAARDAQVAALTAALTEADDALVSVINYRDANGVHPLDGPITIAVDRAISRSRELLARTPAAPEGETVRADG